VEWNTYERLISKTVAVHPARNRNKSAASAA
jgi:hypothetical protein